MPGLAADLRDTDPRVRRNAIAELAASGSPDPATLLAASRDANLDVALAATEGLGALYRDGAISAQDLVARATDASAPDKVRVVAINGLGAVASPESAAALADLLRSNDEYARRSAAILMVHQDPTIAMPALITALRDTDENTRTNAHESLRSLARGRDLGDNADAWQRWWNERTR
jgi:HEAT repeat protein